MLLGFDFDAVLVRTDLKLCQLLSEKVGRVISPEDITMYDLQACLPELSDIEIENVINDLVSIEHTFQIPPYSGSMNFLRWYGKHNKIHVITNRPNLEPVYIYLQHNLDRTTFDQVEIHYTKKKGMVARSLGIRYFIEDKIENIISLANCGIVPIIFEQNWNKSISKRSNLYDLVYIVRDWEDVYSIVGCELFNY